MTDEELNTLYEWQMYCGILENCRSGLKPTAEGFYKFQHTVWTKEMATEDGVEKRAKECEEISS